jgi:molybdate transport system substrate-binding protein
MKGKYIRLALLILACLVLLAGIIGCSGTGPAYANEIFIFAAGGTKPAIDEAAKLFEQKYGTKVTINYGGGGGVLSAMVLAKTGDVYVSPEQKFMDVAREQGAIDANSAVTTLAYMIPVIGVKKGNPKNILSLADLAKPGIQIVMGNPETTALGDIVPQMLQKAGLYDAVKQNIVADAPQVTAMITMLKMSQVDAAVIWNYFGTATSNDVDIIWIPKEYVTGIGEIQTAVSTYSQEETTAQKFIDLLVSPEGKEIFKKNGYIVDREEADKYWLANQ